LASVRNFAAKPKMLHNCVNTEIHGYLASSSEFSSSSSSIGIPKGGSLSISTSFRENVTRPGWKEPTSSESAECVYLFDPFNNYQISVQNLWDGGGRTLAGCEWPVLLLIEAAPMQKWQHDSSTKLDHSTAS
jgi:hypothetical protein